MATTQNGTYENRYAGKCKVCGEMVGAYKGQVTKNTYGTWIVSHVGKCPAPKPAPRCDTYCEECGAAVPNGHTCPICGERDMLTHTH